MTMNRDDIQLAVEPAIFPEPEEPDSPGFVDTITAAGRLYNATTNIVEQAYDMFTQPARDPKFNPWLDNEGTIFERHPKALHSVDSAEEKEIVRARLEREERDLETIGAAGGWGIAASMASGMFDPIMWILPVSAAANTVRASRAGATASSNALRGAAVTARAGLFGSTAAELALQANQEARGYGEGLLDISVGTVMSGLLGGAASLVSHGAKIQLARDLNADLAQGGSEFGRPMLQMDKIVTDAANAVETEIKIQPAAGVDKIIAKLRLNPVVEVLTNSYSQQARRIMLRLADQPMRVDGAPDVPSIDSTLRLANRDLERIKQAERTTYGAYKQRMRAAGKKDVSQQEFREMAGKSQRLGQMSGSPVSGKFRVEPEAAELAKFDDAIYKRMAKEMIDLDMLPEEVLEQGPEGAAAYLKRSYDVEKIDNDLLQLEDGRMVPRFQQIAKRWLGETLTDEETGGIIKKRLGRDAYEQWERERKITAGDKPEVTEFSQIGDLSDEVARLRATGGKESAEQIRLLESAQKTKAAISGAKSEDNLVDILSFFTESLSRGSGAKTVEQRIAALAFNEARAKAARNQWDTLRIAEKASKKRQLTGSTGRKISPKETQSRMIVEFDTAKKRATRARAANKARASKLEKLKAQPRATEAQINKAIADEIDQASESILAHVTGRAKNQNLIDGPSNYGDASPFQGRKLTWKDEDVIDFLDNDITRLTENYIRTVVPRLELYKLDAEAAARAGGDAKPSHLLANTMQEIREEYQVQRTKTGITPEKIAHINKKAARDEEILIAMRDRLLGTYRTAGNHPGMERGMRTARGLNLLAQGGQFMISSIPDIGMVILRNGLARTLKTAAHIALDPKGFKISMSELKSTGAASEWALAVRALEMADLGGAAGAKGFDRAMNNATVGFSKYATGLSAWNHMMKNFSGAVFQTRMIDTIEALANGRRVKARDMDDLRQLRISDDMARRIHDQISGPNGSGASDGGGMKWANTENWTDDGARIAYRTAVGQMVDNTIITPGIGDRPLLMSGEIGKTILQYKSFALAATSRVMGSSAQGLRKGDVDTIAGIASMVALGMFVEQTKRMIAGKEPEEDMGKLVAAGLDRSGVIGIMGDPLNIMDKLGYGIVDGGPLSSRFASRNVASSLMGPTMGLTENTLRLVSAGSKGVTEGDVKTAVRMLPYSNLPYWRAILGDLPENVAADMFNAPRSRSKR